MNGCGDVFVVDCLRTPIGRFGGSLRDIPAHELGSIVVKELLERAGLSGSDVDVFICGQVLRAGTGMCTARRIAVEAGISSLSFNVDMVCSSGMMAAILASSFLSDTSKIAIVCAVESMSQSPFLLSPSFRWGLRVAPEGLMVQDSLVKDGLTDPLNSKLMGKEADEIATREGATKEVLDFIGVESHRRAAEATEKGFFRRFMLPVNMDGVELSVDECIRFDTSIEKVRHLRPAFGSGPHTAATSSQLGDGAAALLFASESACEELGLKPSSRVVGWAYTSISPMEFPLAPVHAVRELLASLGWTIDDVDFWENNEAFAVHSFLFHKYLGVSYERLNVHGGAIALGHPLGMSGARIILELINVLHTNRGERGIASICHGLGGATAIALEKA